MWLYVGRNVEGEVDPWSELRIPVKFVVGVGCFLFYFVLFRFGFVCFFGIFLFFWFFFPPFPLSSWHQRAYMMLLEGGGGIFWSMSLSNRNDMGYDWVIFEDIENILNKSNPDSTASFDSGSLVFQIMKVKGTHLHYSTRVCVVMWLSRAGLHIIHSEGQTWEAFDHDGAEWPQPLDLRAGHIHLPLHAVHPCGCRGRPALLDLQAEAIHSGGCGLNGMGCGF